MASESPQPLHGFSLKSKIGPIEAWEWVVIGVLAYVIYSRFLHKPVAAASTDTGAATIDGNGNDAGVDDSSYTGSNASDYSGGNSSVGGNTAALSGLSTPTNQSWVLNSINGLLGSQYSAADVEDALTNFAAGNPLTAAQRDIVNTAITRFGAPPTPIPFATAVGVDTGSANTGSTDDGTPTVTSTAAPSAPVATADPVATPVATAVPVAAPAPTQATPAQIARKEAAKAAAKKDYDAALAMKTSGIGTAATKAARVAVTYAAYWAAANKPALEY